MIFFGHPSYYFTSWYFYNPEHIHHYPRLCNTYVDHYYGPRGHIRGSDMVVRKWVNDNRNYLPRDFTTNRTNRVEAIKQVGQLNAEARKELGRNTISPAEREQFYQKNSAKYPSLNANHQAIKENENRQQNITMPEPEKQPAIRIPKSSQQPSVVPDQNIKQQNQQQRTAPANNFNNFNNINKAQEYHRNTWESVQPVSRPQAPSYSQPAQRSQQPERQAPPSHNNSPAPRKR
jgi:hypothetical protein